MLRSARKVRLRYILEIGEAGRQRHLEAIGVFSLVGGRNFLEVPQYSLTPVRWHSQRLVYPKTNHPRAPVGWVSDAWRCGSSSGRLRSPRSERAAGFDHEQRNLG
jgi:hypothetical protein